MSSHKDTPSSIQQLVACLAKTRELADSDPVWDIARMRFADTAACTVAGTTTEEGADLFNVTAAVSANRPSGTYEMIAYLVGVTRHTEFDDIHIGTCTTLGAVIIPTCLAIGTCGLEKEVDDRTLLLAAIAGYEATIRLGASIESAFRQYSGIWATYITAPFGAAAAASVMLGLDDEKTAYALAIAAARCVGTKTKHEGGPTAHWYTLGLAAADGYMCAVAASQGMEGDLEVLEQSFGQATDTVFDAAVFNLPSTAWKIAETDTKPFRCQRQALSATQAFHETIADRDWHDASSIAVFVPQQLCKNVDYKEPPLHRNSPGVQYLMGLAATGYERLYDVNRVPVRNDDEIRSLMAKVTIHPDDNFTTLFPRQWAGRVETTWSDGTTTTAEVIDPYGSGLSPMNWEDLLAKHQTINRAGKIDEGLAPLDAKMRADWLVTLFQLCQNLGTSGHRSLDEIVDVVPAAFRLANCRR